ncbi:MAG TPA: MFS transporter [Tepidisphaeraceae bacterium]
MTDRAVADDRPERQQGGAVYYGWVNLAVAALAMVATLPGRSQGLGLVTEPMLRNLNLSHVDFGKINLVATLLGSAFCLACGPLIDRFGSRAVLSVVSAALGFSVLAMARASHATSLWVTLTVTRGLGQSALSVVSIAIVGKWFVRRLPTAMGVYSILAGVGFVIAFPGVGYAVQRAGWRPTWETLGWVLAIGFSTLAWIVVRRTPESIGLSVDGGEQLSTPVSDESEVEWGLTLAEAMASPAFWAFALGGFAFSLVSSGLMLFNEAVLTEHGMGPKTVLIVLAVITFTGMAANLLGGWLAQRWPIGRVMASAMFLLATALFSLPLARGPGFTYAYAVTMGTAAGLVTVVFFMCWAQVFGRRHLGAIQGAAQLLTVLGSAAGPWLLAESIERTGSSTPLLFALGPVIAALGLFCLLAPKPAAQTTLAEVTAPSGSDSHR